MTAPPTKWEGATLKVSNSEIQTWKGCRRKWYLTYYLELGLKRAHGRAIGARELGSRVHVALHALYADNLNPLQVLDEVYAMDMEEVRTWPNTDDALIIEMQKEQDLAKAMVAGFLEWRAEEGVDDGMELIAAETALEVPSPIAGVTLRGKLDQRWHRKIDGAKLFRDWKTVGNLSDPPKLLPLDEQMKFYHLLEYLDSIDKTGSAPQWRTDGGQYLMLRKVKRTATAKPPFYANLEVHHNLAELRSMWRRTIKVLEEIVTARLMLEAADDNEAGHQYHCPPRPSRDCTWSCDFFPVCPMMDDGSNWKGLLAEYYEHVDPHERYNAVNEGREVTQ